LLSVLSCHLCWQFPTESAYSVRTGVQFAIWIQMTKHCGEVGCYISILYPLVQCSQPVKLLPSQRAQCHRVGPSRYTVEEPNARDSESSSQQCTGAVQIPYCFTDRTHATGDRSVNLNILLVCSSVYFTTLCQQQRIFSVGLVDCVWSIPKGFGRNQIYIFNA
jgi:hypothetical protein